MKLLIVTQKVDRNDPILGFFHRWLLEFAAHCEKLTVITQVVGEHALPANTQVISLGKDGERPKFLQVLRFWSLQWTLRKDYDAVLVHMTPIWVVFGALPWFLLRKRTYLWYEARGVRWPLKIALRTVKKVFSASAHGMPLMTLKSVIVGHGIDTVVFSPSTETRDPHSLVTVGRITKAKNIEVILNALAELPPNVHLAVIGIPITQADEVYEQTLMDRIRRLNLHNRVTIQPLPQVAIIPLLGRASIFVHASSTSLDKAVLEAMACGTIVVSCAEAAKSILPTECQAAEGSMPTVIQSLLTMSLDQQDALRVRLREIIVRDHSLQNLIPRLITEMSNR